MKEAKTANENEKEHMRFKGSIGYNYIMNTIIQGSAYILPLIVNPYVSGILGPEGMGKVSFVTAVLSYFTILAVLGVPTYGVREVSKVKGDREKVSRTVYEILNINLIMGFLTYLCFFIYALISSGMTEYRELLLVMSPTILLNIIGLDWMYKGLEEFSVIAVRNVIIKAIAIGMIFVCIRDKEDLILYGLLTVCAAYGSNLWNFLGKKRYICKPKREKREIRKHIMPVLIFFSMTVATTIYTNLDMVMLGTMKNDYEAGIYDAASKLKIILVSAVSSLGTVLLPRVTALVNQGKMDEFRRISRHALALIIIFSFSLAVYFEVNAESLIGLFSGKAFDDAVPVLRVLVPTIILIGITNITGIQMLIPLGREKVVLASEIAGAIVDLLINMILIPQYGALGAAIGTLIAELIVFFIQAASADYVRKILCSIQFCKIGFSGITAGILMLLFGNCINNVIWKLLCSGILFYLLYGALLFIMRERECRWILEKIKYK